MMKRDFKPEQDPSRYAAFYAETFTPQGGSESLHYTPPGYIGDVHPYYRDGVMYLFHLKTDGNFSSSVALSRNLLQYEQVELTHDNRLPINHYYVLNVVFDGEWYRSFYGAGRVMASSKSRDLLHWENGEESESFRTLYQAENTYPCDGRDPFVFFDPDVGRWRIVSTAYYTNDAAGRGEGMDCAIALSTSEDETLRSFAAEQRELLHFPDGYSGEPEVTQMLKLGNRWYLFASMARRTEHHVGPVSYWIGDEGKTIDEVDWSGKEERLLTGQDLCAAQLTEVSDRLYLLGWIPQQSRGNAWGGTLNLPREIYVKNESGELGSRLDPCLSGLLREEKLPEGGDGSRSLAEAALPRAGGGFSLCYTDAANAVTRVRLSDGVLSIVAPDGYEYASIACKVGAEEPLKIQAVLEDDVLEVFVNETVSLCARLDGGIPEARITLDAEDAGAGSLELYRLPYLSELSAEGREQ